LRSSDPRITPPHQPRIILRQTLQLVAGLADPPHQSLRPLPCPLLFVRLLPLMFLELLACQWFTARDLLSYGSAYLSFSPQAELNFLFLGETRPFCILGQNGHANKARNRPCSISRAERKADWPKFFVTFPKYSCPSIRHEKHETVLRPFHAAIRKR
jgi:hypothetical protein